MISKEQIELTSRVKSVHHSLRKRSNEIGPDDAWKEHLADQTKLENYASAMKSLAETYWTINNQGSRSCYCRIDWIINEIKSYYSDHSTFMDNVDEKTEKIKLLDVGSCYNPFENFDFLQTVAVDICPATSSVIKCNFLDIETGNFSGEIQTLLASQRSFSNYFDVVVFCLLLEYLPSYKLREQACQKAWNVLKENGLLLIVTPDSKHESANSKLMKTWKLTLGTIGFKRVNMKKLRYLYCMSFQKINKPAEIVQHDEYHLWIPQDFVNYLEDPSSQENGTREDDSEIADSFCFLPYYDSE